MTGGQPALFPCKIAERSRMESLSRASGKQIQRKTQDVRSASHSAGSNRDNTDRRLSPARHSPLRTSPMKHIPLPTLIMRREPSGAQKNPDSRFCGKRNRQEAGLHAQCFSPAGRETLSFMMARSQCRQLMTKKETRNCMSIQGGRLSMENSSLSLKKSRLLRKQVFSAFTPRWIRSPHPSRSLKSCLRSLT